MEAIKTISGRGDRLGHQLLPRGECDEDDECLIYEGRILFVCFLACSVDLLCNAACFFYETRLLS